MANDQRPRLDSILGGSGDDFNTLWESTDAAGDFEPLPPGSYTCLLTDSKLAESRLKQTPGFKITFEVITPAKYAGRKIWHDLWLTAKALPTTKRDLAKLGITHPDQMGKALPTGMMAMVKVVLRTDDDGTARNRVLSFAITGEAPPSAALELDSDELCEDDGVDGATQTPSQAALELDSEELSDDEEVAEPPSPPPATPQTEGDADPTAPRSRTPRQPRTDRTSRLSGADGTGRQAGEETR